MTAKKLLLKVNEFDQKRAGVSPALFCLHFL